MATVVADMSMSVDGFIADRNDEVGPLFDWYRDGPVTTPSGDERWSFHTDEASARQLRELLKTIGALICGRRQFELTHAWGGRHPIGCPVVVVTHTVPEGWPRADAPFTFVSDGVESAVAPLISVGGIHLAGVPLERLTRDVRHHRFDTGRDSRRDAKTRCGRALRSAASQLVDRFPER
jgi:dihydrofolate reductase